MHREPSTIETIGKQETPEKHEAPISVESPEQIRQQMMDAATQEVDGLSEECVMDLEQFEARAERDGLVVDVEDKTALQEFAVEADVAKDEFEAEISDEDNEKILEEKFGGFVKDKKKFYQEIGGDVLVEAHRAKDWVMKDMNSFRLRIEEYKSKAEELRLDIDSKKSNIINRILEFSKIKELEKKLGFQEENIQRLEGWVANKEELVDAYDYMIREEIKLFALIEEAHKENSEWDENKRKELIEEEERRDVSSLVKKHGVFFCHDIVDADWKPSANNKAIDTTKLDFNDQLDILHGLDPTISVSTLHKGSKQRTFGKGSWGVFLSGGRVLGGEESDAGTVARGLRDRKFWNSESETTESIENAITRKNFEKYEGNHLESSSYNELVVENPEIAGVYVKWDDEEPVLVENNDIYLKNGENIKYDRWWESLSGVMKRGIPLFVLNRENNTVRLMYDVDVKNRSFRVTPEYNPENLIDMPGIYKQHTGKEEKRKSVMRVFDKALGIIPEEERNEYIPDGTENKNSNYISVH